MQREHAEGRHAAGLEKDPAAQNLMRDVIYQREHAAVREAIPRQTAAEA